MEAENVKETIDCSRIKILEVIEIGLATELPNLDAFYPCTIKWCAADIDSHVAELSPNDFIFKSKVTILSCLKSAITEASVYSAILPNVFEKEIPRAVA